MAEKSQNGFESGYQLPFEKPIAALARQIADLESAEGRRDFSANVRELRAQYVAMLKTTYSSLSPWETVQVARHPNRPLGGDYIERIVKNFVESHGDRYFADDRAIRCGLGRIGTEKVMLIAQHKGRDTKEKIVCNFGCAHPEGYRKALRVMKLAEKFGIPVVSLIDTQGGYSGHRLGGARRGRGDREEPDGDEPPPHADRMRGDRRGRLRRRWAWAWATAWECWSSRITR